eukprot:gb/GFBE01000770.1/.p1 GENE.gb/GFBE01000770.1/~~gb/GFBE01000770.1/.p1  ORF type:complete len:167 (+),score=33.98 gb/GFBE01000770.1/:1-501(+)
MGCSSSHTAVDAGEVKAVGHAVQKTRQSSERGGTSAAALDLPDIGLEVPEDEELQSPRDCSKLTFHSWEYDQPPEEQPRDLAAPPGRSQHIENEEKMKGFLESVANNPAQVSFAVKKRRENHKLKMKIRDSGKEVPERPEIITRAVNAGGGKASFGDDSYSLSLSQ